MFPSLVMPDSSKYLKSSVLLFSVIFLLKNAILHVTSDSINVFNIVGYTWSKKYIYRKGKKKKSDLKSISVFSCLPFLAVQILCKPV